MTQTLQQALLKAGLISQEKLKKAEADKKAAQRAARTHQKPAHPQSPPRTQASSAPKSAQPAPLARPAKPPVRIEEPPKKKSLGFIEGKHHHHIRTHCEACGKTSPDVEYYEHKNRALDKYWLCVRCADDNNILDEYRQTVQSSHAQKGFFQRGYGPTKIFRKKI